MAPHYKLMYFDVKGLGECIKYIFEYKNIEYENEVITLSRKVGPWKDLKASMPFGQLPVLEVDGERLYQSLAICQYLGEMYGLAADSLWETAHLNAISYSFYDHFIRVVRYYYTNQQEEKASLKQEQEEIMIPFYFSRFENLLKSKGDFFGGKLTWLDFYMVAGFESINGMMGADYISGKYPALQAHMERVWNLPNIKEYITERPNYTR